MKKLVAVCLVSRWWTRGSARGVAYAQGPAARLQFVGGRRLGKLSEEECHSIDGNISDRLPTCGLSVSSSIGERVLRGKVGGTGGQCDHCTTWVASKARALVAG